MFFIPQFLVLLYDMQFLLIKVGQMGKYDFVGFAFIISLEEGLANLIQF